MVAQIHETAIVEQGVTIGEHTSVWDNVHIRKRARIGSHCIIGESPTSPTTWQSATT